jgi:acetoin:2,6-dichlorophenolindophenol oxidoreductase subunit alpha
MAAHYLVSLFETMVTYRKVEETIAAAVTSGEVHGEMHLGIGQEAIAVALGLHLRRGDAVVSTHRPHLHALALGVDPVLMLAEILERDGLNHGKGGHMHLFDPEAGFMCTGIVGAGAPLALGYALRQSLDQAGGVTVAVTGDGAMNQGAVFESMNLAAVRRLPVVFLCEDNSYSISVRKEESTAGELVRRADAFGVPGFGCDGTDVSAVDAALGTAFEVARQQGRPALVVARAYRFRGHYEGDLDLYRPAAEKKEAADVRDPVAILRSRAEESGVEPAVLDEAAARAESTVDGWFRAAREYPLPRPADARTGVYADD